MVKTNVMRILDKSKIAYEVKEYDTADGFIDGVSVANKLGEDVNMVFKTLVTVAGPGSYFVFVIPVNEELDLKKAAVNAGVKSVSMLPQKELLKVTGYIHGGCSPIGMKKQFRTFIHESAAALNRIAVSAGRVGGQVILSPQTLSTLIGARFCSLTRD